MRSICFSGLIILCLLGFITGAAIQTNELSPYESSAPTTLNSQKLQKEAKNGTYNEDIPKILEIFAKNNLKNIGTILVKFIGNFFRNNPKTKNFADIAEIAAEAIVNYVADYVSDRVYELTKNIHVYDLKSGKIWDLKRMVIRAILSSKEPLKVEIARVIEKKAEELKETVGKKNKILGDIALDKIARIPGIDEEMSYIIKKVIVSAGDNLTNEAYQKLKSPGKDKLIGRFVDHAYNGAAALAKASGEKFSAIGRVVADLQNILMKDLIESDINQDPFL